MATSVTMQSMIVGSQVTNFSQRHGLNQFAPGCQLRRLSRNISRLRVKSMSKDDEKEESSSPLTEAAATPKPTPPPSAKAAATPKPTPPPSAKPSTKFSDVFSFSGPGPERINGRLAMIGFVAAMGVELANGGDLFAQLSSGGFYWFLGTSALLTVASLVPLFQGVSPESKSGNIMTADAEIWNGRFAMLGLVALAFTEYVKGGGLFQA